MITTEAKKVGEDHGGEFKQGCEITLRLDAFAVESLLGKKDRETRCQDEERVLYVVENELRNLFVSRIC